MASAEIFVKREYWELVKEQNQAEKQTDSGQDTKRNGKNQENQCVGLMLAGCQVLIKAVLLLPSSAGQGRGNATEGS